MNWNPLHARRRRVMLRLACGLLALPDDQHYAYPLTVRVGMRPGQVYPMLTRFELRGWVISGWEDPEPEDRPARRWYRLTELGKRELTALVRVPGYDIAHLEKLRSGGI